MIAKVEPLTTARALRGPFDYRIPAEFGDVGVGTVLSVPFARRRLVGVVVGLAERSELPPDKLAEPFRALEHDVPAELVELGLWVAEEYCSTAARGLALVLPPGTGTGAAPRVRARKVLEAELALAGEFALSAADTRLGERQRAVLEALRARPRPVAEVARLAGAGHATLRSLERRGLVVVRERERRRRPEAVAVGATRSAIEGLNAAQEGVLADVAARLENPRSDRRVLLHGVTGSGKTEVYVRAAQAALASGRTAIVLVPEIALAPQTVARFQERFGDAVAVLHSRLSPGERYDEWARLRRGEAVVCVGPRSAIFAPLSNVGLIVVDEEHDSSYKQEGDPRYDARVVAERRAAACGALLLAGSATPRPETRRSYARLVLPERADGSPLPPVELLGMTGTNGPLHARTRVALQDVAAAGEKAIVLVNRRGWSNFLSCRACGRTWECPDCDVTLVLHKAAARVSCHHCGHSEAVPDACPDCGSVAVARHGAGAERLESDLAALLDGVPVLRVDSDAAGAPGGVAELLAGFERERSAVLVGTQMVAKGHDFPGVTLGVVLDADATLRFPDFRAEERTFALVAQLAGRSGRGGSAGRVLVQALDPSARALRHAAGHDSEGFLAGELERRAALDYPPFATLIRVVCSSLEAGRELRGAEAVAERIAAPGLGVLGPAPLFRRERRYRSQVVVKAARRQEAIAAVREAVREAAKAHSRRGVAFAVDVDPQ